MHRSWDRLLQEFSAHHQDPVNTTLHLVTTPLGLWGAMSVMTAFNPWFAPGLVVLYCAALVGRVPLGVWVSTLTLLAALVGLTWWAHVGWALGLLLVAVGYVGQELAHRITGEATFESTYVGRPGMVSAWVEHTALLLPLVLAAAWEVVESPLWWVVAQQRLLHTRLDDERSRRAIDTVRDWVMARQPSREHSTHWWWHELDEDGRKAWQTLVYAPQIVDGLRGLYGCAFEVEPVWEMNEVYVAGPDQTLTSDTVFYDAHLDGPLAVWPFCSVFRCLVAVTPNERIRTHFPMVDPDGRTYVLDEAQVLGFDFNRELHLISADPSVAEPSEPRIVLKAHYVTFPWVLAPLGKALAWATARYNRAARQVFLDTLTPGSLPEKLGAAWVVATTHAFELLGRRVGASNLAWVLLCAAVALFAGSWLPFVLGTSFVHYLVYVGTFHQGRNVSFHTWVRDAVFYKTVSFGTLAVLYLQLMGAPDPLSLGLMGVGFSISMLATKVLGLDRTYFAVELGLAEPVQLTRFPYGFVPHPMITGSVLGLVGVHLVIGEAHPWLVPGHIAFYALHLAQEISGTHRRLQAEPGR